MKLKHASGQAELLVPAGAVLSVRVADICCKLDDFRLEVFYGIALALQQERL